MPQQLAYVIITPYSLHKSRTGGILTRLITRTGCELVAARMFAPSAELVKKYLEETDDDNVLHSIRKILKDFFYTWDYIQEHADFPDTISEKEKLKSFTTTLGNFIDESTKLEFLQPEYLDKIENENERLMLLQIKKEWNNEKFANKEELRHSLSFLRTELDAMALQTNEANT